MLPNCVLERDGVGRIYGLDLQTLSNEELRKLVDYAFMRIKQLEEEKHNEFLKTVELFKRK